MDGEVVFLAGNPRLAPPLMRRAREMGYTVRYLAPAATIANLDPAIAREADVVAAVDTYDVTKVIYHLDGRRTRAVLALDDYHLVLAALVSRALGLPGENLQGLVNTRFKDKARACLSGAPGAIGHAVIPEDRPPAESPLGYPCIVKPLDAAGSTGVRICRDGADFKAAVEDIQRHNVNLKGYRFTDRLLVEEYVAGPEFSAELGWDNRRERWHLVGFTQKTITAPPYCVELAHVFPHRFDEALAERIHTAILGWLERVGFDHGMAHVEFKLIDGQPRLMEINPRVSGDLIDRLVWHTTGIDLSSWYMDLHLGVPVQQDVEAQPQGLAMVRFVVAEREGTVVRLEVDEDLRALVTEHELWRTPRRIRGLMSSDDRLAYAIRHGTDPATIRRDLDRFVDGVRIVYEES